jgi:MraZ protein
MLIGQYKHSIDVKKRLSLPAKFRSELGEKVVITRGVDNCLVVYTEHEWAETAGKLSKLTVSSSEARSYARMTLAGAMEASLDKLGRILIPDYLKEYAGLSKDVVVCGLVSRLELWDAKKWEEYRSKAETEVDSIASKLGPLGI